MKKRELLQQHLEMLHHNLMCYSKTLLMNSPKEGYEKEWKEANLACDLMEEIIKEFPEENHDNKLTFVGTVSSYEVEMNLDHVSYIKSLIVHDRDDNYRMFGIEFWAGKKILDTYDEERHLRYDQGKDTLIEFTVSNSFQTVESWKWKVE